MILKAILALLFLGAAIDTYREMKKEKRHASGPLDDYSKYTRI